MYTRLNQALSSMTPYCPLALAEAIATFQL